jgi:hypothetical protein
MAAEMMSLDTNRPVDWLAAGLFRTLAYPLGGIMQDRCTETGQGFLETINAKNKKE